MKERIRAYIAGELLLDQEPPPGDDDDLLMTGLVDSMGIMRLVNFLEEELSTAVPPTDITVENFLTIGHIARYVDERTGA